ncbi:MAG TPA: hypothetical protein ENI95_04405 [Chloroflexi bacterium]|nr:hypothetical protein [Chloroflexota bacterium]
MRASKPRFPWIALLAGLILGFSGGLYYAWFLNPVNLVNIAPSQLTSADQQAYILLISEAYLHDGDLERARERLATLGIRDVAQAVAVQADSAFLAGADTLQIRALTTLAEALGAQPMAADIFSGTIAPTPVAGSAIPTATSETVPSPTPSPSPTPISITPTPTPLIVVETELELIGRNVICDDEYPAGLIEIYVSTEFGRGIPAVEVQVMWEGGEDTFYTGLKPEVNPGYADFQMEPGQVYTVTLVGLSEPVVGIDSSDCFTGSGQISTPTYQLFFAPPQGESGE